MSFADDTIDRTQYSTPVPKALDDPARIYSESVADNTVVLDAGSMHYHNLNATAARVWALCDGKRTVSDIANQLRSQGSDVPDDAVALAVAQLGDAELLQTAPAIGTSRFHRRRVLKLAAAGLIGAGALPLVESITVPHAASALTPVNCCVVGSPQCGPPGQGFACITVSTIAGIDLGVSVNVCAQFGVVLVADLCFTFP